LDNLAKLRDIKPIVEIPDHSIYIFSIVIILCLVGVTLLSFYLYKWIKNRKGEKYSFNLNNSKETAYKLIEIIRGKEGSEKYIEQLHNYTYKKEVPPFDKNLFDETVEKFKIRFN